MYEYKVEKILKVLDGDTIDAVIDLGFGLRAQFRFRLARINAPEMSTPGGAPARAYSEHWLKSRADRPFIVRTRKHSETTVGVGDGAYGRWLADLISTTPAGIEESLSDALLASGHAVRYPPVAS